MIKIGEYQTLQIKREMPQGFYLEDEEGNEVLMPRAYMEEDMNLEDELEVFVYCDSDDMEIATTERPFFTVGQFAYLQVRDVNKMGAFCDWGVSKQLFIPFRNQAHKLQRGQGCIVYLYLDEVSDRLVGTTKIKAIMKRATEEDFKMGEEVDLLVYSSTNLGYGVIINQIYGGLVYQNEAHQLLQIGEKLKGYVKPIREDGKLDISLFPIGHQSIEPNAQKILDHLERNDGFLPFTDKSDPIKIRKTFGISKKLFKKSLGALYRKQLVILKEDGIYKA